MESPAAGVSRSPRNRPLHRAGSRGSPGAVESPAPRHTVESPAAEAPRRLRPPGSPCGPGPGLSTGQGAASAWRRGESCGAPCRARPRRRRGESGRRALHAAPGPAPPQGREPRLPWRRGDSCAREALVESPQRRTPVETPRPGAVESTCHFEWLIRASGLTWRARRPQQWRARTQVPVESTRDVCARNTPLVHRNTPSLMEISRPTSTPLFTPLSCP